MKDKVTLITKHFGVGGTPGMIGLLCSQRSAELFQERFPVLPAFICPDSEDPILIDTALAQYVETVASEGKYMIGAVTWPKVEAKASCGAVIGLNGENHINANKRLIMICDDLWMWTYPGVCGFAIAGSRKEADCCVDTAFRAIRERHEPWYVLEDLFKGKTFLYVSDSVGRFRFTEGLFKSGESEGS